MRNVLFEEIYQEIIEHEMIIIHRHIRPDPDALGSQNGLAELIRHRFPLKKVYSVGVNVESLAYLGKMQEVDTAAYKEALVIVTDTANQPRIDDKRYLKGKKLIKIDHHPNEDSFGDIRLVCTQASSTSEIIADFSFYLKERLPMNPAAARLLYAGIIGDTGRFLYPAATAHTFAVAAQLTKFDFSASALANRMNTTSQKVAKLSGFVLQNLQISKTGVAFILLDEKLLNEFAVEDDDTAQVVPLPGTIEGVLCWGIFVQQTTGEFRCRLRSKGPKINEIAKLHGGGGHPLASGANATDFTEIKAILHQMETAVAKWKEE